jgi:hypothetical protein
MVDPIASFTAGGQVYDIVPRTPAPEPTPDPKPDPEPELEDPLAAAEFVRIGTWVYPVAAVNPTPASNPAGFVHPTWAGRGEEQLVAYRAPIGRTETNGYGREVVVIDGGVAAVGVNRLVVPASGFVLSGHGAAADGLTRYAKVGAVVELLTEAPAPGPAAGRLVPGWVVGGYWQQFEGPKVSTVTAEAPQYNLLFAAFATGGGGQAMTFRPVVQDETSFRRDVAASREHGARWCLSIGGGVPASSATVLRTKTDAARCYDALAPIIDQYGFQGVDDDLENGPAGFTEEGLTELFARLRRNYGREFILTSTPRPYESWRVPIAAHLYEAGLLDLLMFQFYDSPEYRNPEYLRSRIIKELDGAKKIGVPYSAQIIGCITRTTYQYGWNTIATYRQIISEMKSTRGVRGGFVWEVNMDRAEGWSFARQISALGSAQ